MEPGNKRIYLAAPYNHRHYNMRRYRFKLVTRKAAELMEQGHLVFSPVTQGHCMDYYMSDTDGDFWKRWYRTFLELWATDLYVLTLTGWKNSRGVATEIEMAEKLGLPVTYIDKG